MTWYGGVTGWGQAETIRMGAYILASSPQTIPLTFRTTGGTPNNKDTAISCVHPGDGEWHWFEGTHVTQADFSNTGCEFFVLPGTQLDFNIAGFHAMPADEWFRNNPVLDSGGSLATGYSTASFLWNRAASSASVTIDEPVSVACWYREEYSGAKSFAYLDTLGQLGDYGDISWSGGDLTISTSRNLVIGPFAAFDRELTAQEQANLAKTQRWNLRTVLGGNPYTNFQLRPY